MQTEEICSPPSHVSDSKSLTLDSNTPLQTAREYLKSRYSSQLSVCTLVHFQDDFYEWCGTHYLRVDGEKLRGSVYKFTASSASFKPNKSKVNNVIDAVRALVHQSSSLTVPSWLDDRKLPPAASLVSCRNGLLHISENKLLDHTPFFFNLNSLDFSFDPHAPEPTRWVLFLNEIFCADREAIDCLQEMFGYALTYATDQQKIFLIIGPPRSGKGTVARILAALVGSENVVHPTLASFSQNFGLSPLIGKQLAIIADARTDWRHAAHVAVERLLSISGEDSQTIDRKYKSAWSGKLLSRIAILSNELPALPDASGALATRMIILRLTKSFLGREDIQLTEKLKLELPGILNWAIAGLRRLMARGHFIQPNSAADVVAEMQDIMSPIGSFVRDNCKVNQDQSVEIKVAYEGYCRWLQSRNLDSRSMQEFSRQIRAAVPSVRVEQRTVQDKRVRFYTGIGLIPLTARADKPLPARDDTRIVQLNPKSSCE